jgi:hypothetical protein
MGVINQHVETGVVQDAAFSRTAMASAKRSPRLVSPEVNGRTRPSAVVKTSGNMISSIGVDCAGCWAMISRAQPGQQVGGDKERQA